MSSKLSQSDKTMHSSSFSVVVVVLVDEVVVFEVEVVEEVDDFFGKFK
jgi:hypothetical protein